MILGKVSVDDIPEFYQDVNSFNSHKYLPFPPIPAVVLIPFVYLFPKITEQFVSILLGSLNISLTYLLLKRFSNAVNAILLSIFVAFGTVYFWVSIVGTSWNFSHIVSYTMITISLILATDPTRKYSSFTSGLFFAFAGLSRLTVIASGLFFVINYWKDKKNLIMFLTGAFLFVPIYLGYNYLRFGNLLETGYTKIYEGYINNGYTYSIQRVWFPESEHPKYMDPKSIPYHLYTMLIIPPEIKDLNILTSKPSPFGLGIIYMSPLLLIIFTKLRKGIMELQSWLGAVPIALLTFSHYAQGWVQFGYRFLVDFLPFLMIVMALKFRPSKANMLLLVISIFVTYWGTNWAIKLGW